jgi:hypothetical protein
MPLFGTLKTMALPDLLQWLAAARMTGTLQIEHNKVSKSITLEKGLLIGCSSEDPPELLGQFLIARGKLTEEQLRQAFEMHQKEGKHLGLKLIEMGILTEDELTSHLEAKAEEIIYSLFDWDDAVFRFHQEQSDERHIFPVSLRVEHVLLRGLKRVDEVRQIREVFDDPALVLAHTAKEPPKELFENEMARTLYGAIDGERTVAEILLHVHGSQYIVTKFLYGLHRNGYVEITGKKQAEKQPEQVLEPSHQLSAAPDPEPARAVSAVSTAEEPLPESSLDLPPVETEQPQESCESGELELLEHSDTHRLERRLEKASQLMSQAEYETALEILDQIYQEYPGDESLRRLTSEAEAAFIEKAYRHYLPAHKIAILTHPVESYESENLSPTEFFMLSRIDGSWDIKSIVLIAPLREADALRTLKRMREKGMIDLREPQ